MIKYILPALLLLTAPAQAQSTCAPYDQVNAGLQSLGEHVVAVGNHPIGGIEFWANTEKGTFTIVGRPKDKPELGCLIMDGVGFKMNPVGKGA